jgi:solute carrier family 25 carnitine/acylcarnitine transporter 20/29
MPDVKKTQPPFYQVWLFAVTYNNSTLIVGHPAERLKIACQTNLHQPSWQVIKPYLTKNPAYLYRALPSCAWRQNTKILHRTYLMTNMPNWVDSFQLPFLLSTGIKAMFSSVFDTFIISVFENIKGRQMQQQESLTMLNTAKKIFQKNGVRGFFSGTAMTIAKSYPSWFYLFLGYHTLKDLRTQNDFLSTIFWATAASAPITFLTTPLDGIKSLQQANLCPEKEKSRQTAKRIIDNHGVTSLWRGFPFRLLHKSLATAAGYWILDLSSGFSRNSSSRVIPDDIEDEEEDTLTFK